MNSFHSSLVILLMVFILAGNCMAVEIPPEEGTEVVGLYINDAFVNELTTQNEGKYCVIPLIPILEAMQIPLQETTEGDITFSFHDIDYVISREKNTVICLSSGFDALELPPGTEHKLVKGWVDDEFVVDNDTLRCFFVYYLNLRFSVNAAGDIRIRDNTPANNN